MQSPQRASDSAGFVTTLGRDTVALESYRRTSSRVDGDIVLRVPNTVRFHYVLDLRSDGTVSRSHIDMRPMGNDQPRRQADIEFMGKSVRVIRDSSGSRDTTMHDVAPSAAPILTTGFASSFGIYTSIGMLQVVLDCIPPTLNDTGALPVVAALNGRAGTRQIVRRSTTAVDVDYFRIAWTHLTLDSDGRIQRVDASETTEKTLAQRTGPIDVVAAAKDFAARDAAGRGIGVASPADSARATVGAASILVLYSSPRVRGRQLLGETVPYERVWRTGANAATTLHTDQPLLVGGTLLPAGTYSVWTLPKPNGADLILNRQHGQWGTEYNAATDVVRLPMQLTHTTAARENFAILLPTHGREGEFRIEWGDFAWSVPLRAVDR